LHAVAALVATVAEAAGIVLVGGHATLEVGARQIVEQHLGARADRSLQRWRRWPKSFLLVREQQVVTAVGRVVLRGAGVDAEQVGEGCRGKPVPVQPPLAAGREQSVDHKDVQDFFPVGVLAADGQPGAEKVIEVQRAPALIGEPARTPLAGMFEAEGIAPHLHRRGAAVGRRAVGRKERELAGLARSARRRPQGCAPRRGVGCR